MTKRATRPKNCEKIMSGPKIYVFSSVFRKKNSRAGPRPPFKPGPPDVCQVCQVGDTALALALVTITEVGIL